MAGGTLLVKRAALVATCDDFGRELQGASIFARGGFIEQVGPAEALPQTADVVLDAEGHLVVPGFINTHHHMYQSLTRALPQVQDAELFSWLRGLYPVWAHLTPEMARVSAQIASAELLLSGCTTSSDHLYLFPNGVRLDDAIEGAGLAGLRLVATRGAMSVGQSKGGLPPDALVEDERAILADCERVIAAFHDPRPGAMVQIALAPCSPFSVSRSLMVEAAKLARDKGVRLHTHLAENDHDVAYAKEKFGCTPAEYAESLGWLGPDVWHAHAVKLDAPGLARFARTQTGVAHCPSSNLRLASGLAPIAAMRSAGVPVGLGVDGSASNDGADLLAEARLSMLLQRGLASLAPFGCDTGPKAMTARDALHLATRGGAQVLGRGDLGQLSEGKCADLALFDLRTLAFAGAAVHDPVAALLFCAPQAPSHVVVGGKVRVQEGQLTSFELPPAIARHNQLAVALVNRGAP
jgi:8-oxoguanine deaminase